MLRRSLALVALSRCVFAIGALVALGCGGEREREIAGGRDLVEARPRGSVTATARGFEITRRSMVARIDADDPRALFLSGGDHSIRVRRVSDGRATLYEQDDVVYVRNDRHVEARIFATERGVEDLVLTDDDVRYLVELPAGLQLRLPKARRDAVEVVDWRGAPHFRMLAPRAWDEHGQAHPLEVSVEANAIRIALPHEGRWLVDPEWQLGGVSSVPRICTTAVVLADGRVLLSGFGGTLPSSDRLEPILSAEIYDPVSESFALAGDMAAARCDHSATLLKDGRVLIAGGIGDIGTEGLADVGSVSIFDPADDAFKVVAQGPPRRLHSATRLHDGRVLLAGGMQLSELDLMGEVPLAATSSAQLFDPDDDDALLDVDALPFALGDHRATLLSDGTVLVSGGHRDGAFDGITSASLLRFDTESEAWSEVGALAEARHGHAAILMPQLGAADQLLVAGGYDGFHAQTPWGEWLASCELIDLATMQSSPAPALSTPGHAAGMRLPTGDPLLIGGPDAFVYHSDVERFDAASGDFVPAPDLMSGGGLSSVGATVLASGDPLVAGSSVGQDTFVQRLAHGAPELIDLGVTFESGSPPSLTPLATGEVLVLSESGATAVAAALFDPVTLSTTPVPALAILEPVLPDLRTTPLLDGTVLITGITSAWRFDPKTRAVISTSALTVIRSGHSATLMPDGSVLIVGGVNHTEGAPSVERYDPGSHIFTPLDVTLAHDRAYHTALLASDGRLWLFGGSIEALDPISRTSTLVGRPEQAYLAAVPLFDGRLMVYAQLPSGPVTPDAHQLAIVDPRAETVTPLLNVPPLYGKPVLLPSGRVLYGSYLVDANEPSVTVDPSLSSLSFDPGGLLLADGGVLFAGEQPSGPGPVPDFALSLWYESLPPDASWRPRLAAPDRFGAGEAVTLAGVNLLGAEPTDHPSSGRSNHPIALFMPFGGTPTIGGFDAWTQDSVRYTPPLLAHAGPGYLFASVAGQIGGVYTTLHPGETGSPCISASACRTGVCADGVCCERACNSCEACAAELKAEGPDGSCGPAAAGSDPHEDCDADDPLMCGTSGACDGRGQCALYPDGTSCDEGLICIDQACVPGCLTNVHCDDGMICGPEGTCIPQPTPAEPLGCAPCATGPQRDDAAGWWLLAAAASLYRRRRRG